MRKEFNPYFQAFRLLFWLSFLLVGLYFEIASAIIAIGFLILIIYKMRLNEWMMCWNKSFLAVLVLVVFYMISPAWAIDHGMAAWGIAKYYPLLLFSLHLFLLSGIERMRLLYDLPLIGTIMTGVSVVLQWIPSIRRYFSVNERLAGFFQYPNTFACFLLISFGVLLYQEKDKLDVSEMIMGGFLWFGIIQSGSRSIFILSIPVLVVGIFRMKNKKSIFMSLSALLIGSAFSMLVSIGTASDTSTRLSEISLNASTFLGRILYWKDAIRVILQHPFGIGYLGYYFSQASFQTGVYTVRWVHNDVLQLLLDVGWIPAVIFYAVVIKAIVVDKVTIVQKLVASIILTHGMFDFDLEFVAMYFVLLLCLEWDDRNIIKSSAFDTMLLFVQICMSFLSVYFGSASALTNFHCYDTGVKLYPWNTAAKIGLLEREDELEKQHQLALEIIKSNQYISLAWNVLAQSAYTNGDFENVINYKQNSLSVSRYSTESYIEYYEMLRIGQALYKEVGDEYSEKICFDEIVHIQTMIDEVKASTDPLAWKITDKPYFSLPADYYQYIRQNQFREELS